MAYEYSGSRIRHRAALEGEDLVGHRFRNGTTQMVGQADFERWVAIRSRSHCNGRSKKREFENRGPSEVFLAMLRGFVQELLDFCRYIAFQCSGSSSEPGPVVEIPIGALLRVFEIPFSWQRQHHLAPIEDALFSDSSPTEGIHDRVLCFGNGANISWQLLPEGQRIRILRRSWEDSINPEPEPVYTKA